MTMMKCLQNKRTRRDLITYALVIAAFVAVYFLQANRMIPRMIVGQLVPICSYVVMALSLNLVVGVAGDLSLGHAGFMSVGAYTGIVAAMSLTEAVPDDGLRLVIAMIVGAASAALAGFVIGIPVLRLSGDYLAIVTLAFGEIIKEIVTCLIVGVDERGLHVLFNLTGSLSTTKYRMIAFVVSAALAGAAGALFGNGFSQLSATKFDFNTSILILVFVVLGGLGNMRGSIVAAVALTILPEALRQFSDYRMLVYAVVLILVMIVSNNDAIKGAVGRLKARLTSREKEVGADASIRV